MLKLLLPVGGTRNDRFAVQYVIKRFMNDTTMEVHLLNVQMPFSSYVARFTSRKSRQDYHREQAEKALAPAREMLDRHSIPYAVHVEIGDRATIDHGRGPPPALRRDRDGDGAQEFAHAPGGELGHGPSAQAHPGAGGGDRGRFDVGVGALRHPGGRRGGACPCGGGAGLKPPSAAGKSGIEPLKAGQLLDLT